MLNDIRAIENVTVDRTHVIMILERVAVDTSYVIMTNVNYQSTSYTL